MESNNAFRDVQARLGDDMLGIEIQGTDPGLVKCTSSYDCAGRRASRMISKRSGTTRSLIGIAKLRYRARVPCRTYSVEEKRKVNRKVYAPWSSEDDEALLRQRAEGVAISDLAVEFQPGEGAVRSRLLRLGAVT